MMGNHSSFEFKPSREMEMFIIMMAATAISTVFATYSLLIGWESRRIRSL